MSHMLLMSFDESNVMNLCSTLNRFMEYTLSLVDKKLIHFCYIGTAGDDGFFEHLFYASFMKSKFKQHIRVSKLVLSNKQLTSDEIENHLLSQDIIFVGGGNTEKMLQVWEETGFINVLNKLKAENRLPILAGVSAGGMYPFNSSLTLTADGEYKPLSGLDWLQESLTPHADSKHKAFCAYDNNKNHERLDAYVAAVKLGLLPPGYAVPNDCMLHFYNFNFVRALSSSENTNCYYVGTDSIRHIETLHLTPHNIHKSIQSSETYTSPSEIQIKFDPHCWQTLFKCLSFLQVFYFLRQIRKLAAGLGTL